MSKEKKIIKNHEFKIATPQIILQADYEAVIDGCRKIIAYSDTCIHVQTKKLGVKIFGTQLTLRCLNSENIIIQGQIERVEYVK